MFVGGDGIRFDTASLKCNHSALQCNWHFGRVITPNGN